MSDTLPRAAVRVQIELGEFVDLRIRSIFLANRNPRDEESRIPIIV